MSSMLPMTEQLQDYRKMADQLITQIFNIKTNSPEETENAGEKLALSIKKNEFVALYGDLGAGKTAFVRGFARPLTPSADVCSPTYSIINEYEENSIRICHMDAYRIKDEDDLWSCGFYDYTDCYVISEWSENIPFALPREYVRVTITKEDENRRDISAEYVKKVGE